MSDPSNPRAPRRYAVPQIGGIGPIRKNLLQRAYGWLGEQAVSAGQKLDFANTLATGAMRGALGLQDAPDVTNALPVGEMTGLTSGGSALVDSSNNLPLARMDNGLMSLHVDNRVPDALGVLIPGSVAAGRVAREVAEGAAYGFGRAGREMLEAGATGTRMWTGPKSATWNAGKAQAFEDFEQAGGSPESLWRAFGTARLKDGSLIQEIDDSKAVLKTDFAFGKQSLSDVIDHPDFEAAYPQLAKEVKVALSVDPSIKGRGHGSYDSDKKLLTVVAKDMNEARRLMLHEMNHSVSRFEGRATGGSPRKAGAMVDAALADPSTSPELREKLKQIAYDDYEAYQRLQDEVASRGVEARRDMPQDVRDETPPEWDRDPDDWIVSRDDTPGISMGARYAPTKTVKAYKLFRVDPKQPGKLFPLFVEADKPVPVGEWVQAVAGKASKDGKGVSSKIGQLAYRPGWHAGDLPVATHIGGKSKGTKGKKPDYRPDHHVWAEVEMPADYDWQKIANERGVNKKGKLVAGKAHITDQIPRKGHYRYKTNPNMTGEWLISGDMRVNRILSDAEVARINSKAGIADLPRQAPWDPKKYGFRARQRFDGDNVDMAADGGDAPVTRRADQADFQPVSREQYQEAIDAARAAMSPKERASVSRIENDFDGRLFLSPDGTSGFGVAKDGEVVALFKHPSSASAGVMDAALARGAAEGGTHLNAFDHGLVAGYSKRGAKEVSRAQWNDEYAPEGWDTATMGRPDYVTMALGPSDRPVTRGTVRTLTQSEPDIGRSLVAEMGGAKAANAEPKTVDDVVRAIQRRNEYRKEPNVTPGPNATDADWARWGDKYGVNLKVSKAQEVAPGISIPGGYDGTFTIADYFQMKANPFNPRDLGDEGHEKLMQKVIRTLGVATDPVDVFNRLAFSQMSPNAPLLQNGALQARLRVTTEDELRDLANGTGDIVEELGLGAASRGGMGLRGTPDPNEVRALARFVLERPEAAQMEVGESTRDVALRLMNSVPLFSQKTASLGAPTLDMARGSTSAVDLHVIRNNWRSIMRDPDVGPEFVEQLAGKFRVEPTYEAIEAAYDTHPGKGLEVVRSIVERKAGGKTRLKDGSINPRVPQALLSPLMGDNLPANFQNFGPLYDRFSQELTREHIGSLPAFANQWAKWDGYRGRFEPHEFLHPDFKKLPKMGFSEFQRAYKANVDAGYTREGLPKGADDWKKLYYGKATPDLLAILAAGGAGAASLLPLLDDEEQP